MCVYMNNANLRNKILTIDENFQTTDTKNEDAQNSGKNIHKE